MEEYTINNKTFSVLVEEDKLLFPTLYNRTKAGKIQEWTVWVEDRDNGSVIRRVSGLQQGKKQEYTSSVVKGKNIGRKNETSSKQQALLESFSKWTKQHDKGYREVVPKAESREALSGIGDTSRPMLAHQFRQHRKKLSVPFGVSPKIDGIRSLMRKSGDSMTMMSRNNKPFHFMDHIRDAVEALIGDSGIVIDGELYSHELPFNTIKSIVKQQKRPHPREKELQYWIFDIADPNKTYRERLTVLEELFKKNKSASLVLVTSEDCESSEEDLVRKYHNKYVDKGFEGLMARNWDSPYLFDHKSHDLLKYKDFYDEEYPVVGALCSEGSTEDGAIVWVCKTKDGDEFNARPRGSIDHRRVLWKKYQEDPSKFIGYMLTVRYQEVMESSKTKGPVPRFGVGACIRDYE